MGRIPLYEAKNKLTQIVHQVEDGEPVELSRHGRPVAVLIGIEQYNNFKNAAGTFSRRLKQFQSDWPMESTETPEKNENPFDGLRSRGMGRPVEL
jgi:prevent-host-death family protein